MKWLASRIYCTIDPLGSNVTHVPIHGEICSLHSRHFEKNTLPCPKDLSSSQLTSFLHRILMLHDDARKLYAVSRGVSHVTDDCWCRERTHLLSTAGAAPTGWSAPDGGLSMGGQGRGSCARTANNSSASASSIKGVGGQPRSMVLVEQVLREALKKTGKWQKREL